MPQDGGGVAALQAQQRSAIDVAGAARHDFGMATADPIPGFHEVGGPKGDSAAGSAEPEVCPACGVAPDQSTDPERLSRSVCYCGHPRYYDNKHIEGTCPCQRP